MIELEVQALSLTREGLLIDVGRSVVASGFTMQRQRLMQDANGVLLTMIVRGPPRKQRALEAALDANERVISFDVSPFEEGAAKPHFAAARTYAHPPAPPAPPPPVEPAPAAAKPAAPLAPAVPPPTVLPTVTAEVVPAPPAAPAPAPISEPEPDLEFMIMPSPSPVPAPAAAQPAPFVEVIPLDPDVTAVDKALATLDGDYPQIFRRLQTLEQSVPEGAREPSLQLAGQRTGAWVFKRDYAGSAKLDLREAMARIGVPALSALVEVEQKGEQLHIRNSPLCVDGGHSSCTFFSGYLEGLLGPALASESLSIFAVCCRGYGADECVLALME